MEIFLDPMNGVDEWSGINNLKYQFCLVIYIHALGDLTSCIFLVQTNFLCADTAVVPNHAPSVTCQQLPVVRENANETESPLSAACRLFHLFYGGLFLQTLFS
jgi:hypothetical protein